MIVWITVKANVPMKTEALPAPLDTIGDFKDVPAYRDTTLSFKVRFPDGTTAEDLGAFCRGIDRDLSGAGWIGCLSDWQIAV